MKDSIAIIYGQLLFQLEKCMERNSIKYFQLRITTKVKMHQDNFKIKFKLFTV